MSTLKDLLANFNPKSEKELGGREGTFAKLAESFLYGGYISIRDYKGEERYKVYIRTVEFYCHYEGNNENLPKDPIVYHRNGRYIDYEVPYFPLMSFHAHASGYDITFENEELEFRSSALIRAYEVFDVKQWEFLTHNGKWVKCRDVKERLNKQSTYLYDFLNGFMADSIKWIDDKRIKTSDLKITYRQNVYKYDKEGNKLNKLDKARQWSFTRLDEIEKIK